MKKKINKINKYKFYDSIILNKARERIKELKELNYSDYKICNILKDEFDCSVRTIKNIILNLYNSENYKSLYNYSMELNYKKLYNRFNKIIKELWNKKYNLSQIQNYIIKNYNIKIKFANIIYIRDDIIIENIYKGEKNLNEKK